MATRSLTGDYDCVVTSPPCDKDHRKFLLRQPCVVCGRVPSDPHHLTFTQPRALGRRVSDEFTVPARRSVRPVYFDGAFCDTPVYDRAVLRAHAQLNGPAIIEEFGSTTVVFPQQELTVDAHGILVIRPCAGTPSRVPQ
jgi:hydantoinase/oxoprolinase-like protein